MISQVNFARPWDMSGSASGGVGGNNNSGSNNTNNNNRPEQRLTALGLAPLQVSQRIEIIKHTREIDRKKIDLNSKKKSFLCPSGLVVLSVCCRRRRPSVM